MKKKNDRGFTLIELLAVISILALVLSITMYSVTSIIRNAKEKTYLTTINEVEEAAGNYILENSDDLFFIKVNNDNTKEYNCIMVKELIDYGFLNNDVIKSQIDNDGNTINSGNYVYVERNINTKTIQIKKYIIGDENNIYNNLCVPLNLLSGYIRFDINPIDWSRSKNVNIKYIIKNVSSLNKSNYKYGYEYNYDDSNYNDPDGPIKSDNASNPIDVTVKEKGKMYGYIQYKNEDDSEKIEKTQIISKFDNMGPKIDTKKNSERKYVNSLVKIPLYIKDCDKEGKKCSGLKKYSKSELSDIVKKFIVKIGGTKLENNELDLSKKSGVEYELTINPSKKYNGEVVITIPQGTFVDQVADEEKNGNNEIELKPNIWFDTVKPIINFALLDNSNSNEMSSDYYSLSFDDNIKWFNFTPKLKFVGSDDGSGLETTATLYWNRPNNGELVKTIFGNEDKTWNNGVIERTIDFDGYRYLYLEACDKAGNCTRKEVYFKFDKTPPTINISSTSNLLVTRQTLTLTCDDTNGIEGYYFNTQSPRDNAVFTSNNAQTITNPGTYYAACKDSAGNVSIKSQQYWNYTLKYMLAKVGGAEGTYSTENYQETQSNTYLMTHNKTINFDDITKSVPTGSSADKYKGVSELPSSGNATLLSNNSSKVDSQKTYAFWFNRNNVNFKIKIRSGETFKPSTQKDGKTYSWSTNSNGYLKLNNNIYKYIIKYGSSSMNLPDPDNANYIFITKTGYTAVSNEEWVCINGCKTENQKFKKTYYDSIATNDICDASKGDCTVELAVNWQPISYNISYELNKGTYGASHPTIAEYGKSFIINRPSKRITFVGNANGTGATVGSNTAYDQTFTGWKISNSTIYDENDLYHREYYGNMRNTSGTVIMTANWSSGDATLPKVEKSGHTCGWNTSSSGTTIMYESEGTYLGSSIASNSDTIINLYAVCKQNSDDINGDRCYSNDHKIYYITVCDAITYDSNGKTTEDAKCSYLGSNERLLIRKNLRAADNVGVCPVNINYNCTENGGSGSSTEQYAYNKNVDLTKKTCTKSGWEFVGWNTNKNAKTGLASYKTNRNMNVTLYGIYKKEIIYNYDGNKFGISVPIDTSEHTVECSDENTCTSKCTVYNNGTYCSGFTPKINASGKYYFSSDKDDTEWTSSNDLYEESGLRMYVSRHNTKWYVPNNQVNNIRFNCRKYNGDYRLRAFYISTCNGTTCNYTRLNGISTENGTGSFKNDVSKSLIDKYGFIINKKYLSTEIDVSCYREYYINSSNNIPCYEAASASSNKKENIEPTCNMISVVKTTRQVGEETRPNWYYIPDKKCYINGSPLQTNYPQRCSSDSGGSSGTYYIYLDTNGGWAPTSDLKNINCKCNVEGFGSGFCTKIKCYYNSKFYFNSINALIRRDNRYVLTGWSKDGIHKFNSWIDSGENGNTLRAVWVPITQGSDEDDDESGGGCFLKGTKVKTIYGFKNIEQIVAGDLVLSYNEKTHKNEYKSVEEVFIHKKNMEYLYSLTIDNKVLKVTGVHRFYIKRNNELLWLSANKLKVGDMVRYANGTYHKITNISYSLQTNTVYNFKVADNHNYYVSNEMILVHNAKDDVCISDVCLVP